MCTSSSLRLEIVITIFFLYIDLSPVIEVTILTTDFVLRMDIKEALLTSGCHFCLKLDLTRTLSNTRKGASNYPDCSSGVCSLYFILSKSALF